MRYAKCPFDAKCPFVVAVRDGSDGQAELHLHGVKYHGRN